MEYFDEPSTPYTYTKGFWSILRLFSNDDRKSINKHWNVVEIDCPTLSSFHFPLSIEYATTFRGVKAGNFFISSLTSLSETFNHFRLRYQKS